MTDTVAAPKIRMLFVWIRRRVPETKGKSLEQIQQAWTEHEATQAAPRKLLVG